MVIRYENMIERCGVLEALSGNLQVMLMEAHADGTLATMHFGRGIGYKSGVRTNLRRLAPDAETALSAAMADAVRRFLGDQRRESFVRLLCGSWPYTRGNALTSLFDLIMNHLCLFANDGTLMPRLFRAAFNRHGNAPTDLITPMHTFQVFGTRPYACDRFIVAVNETKNPWGAKGNSVIFGELEKVLERHDNRCIASFVSKQPGAHGRTKYMVMARTFTLVADIKDPAAQYDAWQHILTGMNVLGSTLVARVLTERVKPYDGYVEDGFMHAASITRIIDHQMVLGKLDEMIPGMTTTTNPLNEVRPWQLDVYEHVGLPLSSLLSASERKAPSEPGGSVAHASFSSSSSTERTFAIVSRDIGYRAVVAHIVATLRSFEAVEFTHRDPFTSAMLCFMPEVMRGHARAAVYYDPLDPRGGTLYIPFAYTSGWLIKMSKFDRAAVSVPSRGRITGADESTMPKREYHPALDLHALACRLLVSVGLRMTKIRDEENSTQRYAKLGGFTSATLDMLLDMLIPARCIASPPSVMERSNRFEWYRSEVQQNGDKWDRTTIAYGEATIKFINVLNQLRATVATIRDALRTFEKDRTDVLRGLTSQQGMRLWQFVRDAETLSPFCTFPEVSTLTALRDFLKSEHMAVFRQPLEGGLVIMNA